jgi:hypothetical protein
VDNVRLEGVETEIEAQIQVMLRDWDSPLGRVFQDATQIVEDTARIAAPVSPKGSKLAPIGFLKATTRQSLERHHDDEGIIMGLVGASRYPLQLYRESNQSQGLHLEPRPEDLPQGRQRLPEGLPELS